MDQLRVSLPAGGPANERADERLDGERVGVQMEGRTAGWASMWVSVVRMSELVGGRGRTIVLIYASTYERSVGLNGKRKTKSILVSLINNQENC